MEKDKLWNTNYVRVMLTNFAMFFSFYLLTPLLPIYLSETFGATKDMIGLMLSGYTLVALLMRPFSGYMVDSFPRKTVLLICLLVYFLIFFGYIVAGSLLLFAVLRTFHGGPFGASTVANSTMAIDVLPSSRRNEGIGYYGLSNNLASALAPMTGVFIYRYVHNFDILFWIAFAVAGLGFLSALTIKVKPREINRNAKAISLDRFFLLKGWYIALNMCFFGFCWGLLSNYLAIYGKEHLGIESGTGTFFLILSSGLIVSRLIGSRSLRDGHLIRNAAIGATLSMAGYTIFIAWPTMAGYYLSAILIGLGNGHIWPASQNMIISLADNNHRGTANSTILTSWDVGLGIGVLAGGAISEYFSYDAAFWTMVAVHFIGWCCFFLITKRRYASMPS